MPSREKAAPARSGPTGSTARACAAATSQITRLSSGAHAASRFASAEAASTPLTGRVVVSFPVAASSTVVRRSLPTTRSLLSGVKANDRIALLWAKLAASWGGPACQTFTVPSLLPEASRSLCGEESDSFNRAEVYTDGARRAGGKFPQLDGPVATAKDQGVAVR